MIGVRPHKHWACAWARGVTPPPTYTIPKIITNNTTSQLVNNQQVSISIVIVMSQKQK